MCHPSTNQVEEFTSIKIGNFRDLAKSGVVLGYPNQTKHIKPSQANIVYKTNVYKSTNSEHNNLINKLDWQFQST